MIPNPFGAKIEIYGAGAIRATLEIERVNQTKKEKKEQEEKEEQKEQSIYDAIRQLFNQYTFSTETINELINSGSVSDYQMTVEKEGVGKLEGNELTLYWVAGDSAPKGTIVMNLDHGTFRLTTVEELDNKIVEVVYPIGIEGNKTYETVDGTSFHPEFEDEPKDEDITIL